MSINTWYILRDGAQMIIITAVVLVLVRTVATTYTVNGPSMVPTLIAEQRVLVNRLANIRFGEISLYGQRGFLFAGPERGDVIVFEPQQEGPDNIVKRVIGVPGDQILIQDGNVFINGAKSNFIDEYTTDKSHFQYPITVPQGHYFVLGDNRRQSNDSRNWGYVPAEDITGKIWMIYWPLREFLTF